MSQPNPNPDYNYAAKRETRSIPPIASLPPAGGLGGTSSDPAQEIASMIAQLQAHGQEAVDKLARVERERDELYAQLAETRDKLNELTSRDEESRARFIEVTSVIRERDELAESLEHHQKSIAELQRRLDTMQRQELDIQRLRGAAILERDRAVHERDAALQQRDLAVQDRDEARAKIAEAQKQVLSLRQARDSAQAQCQEFSTKARQLGDELQELTYERDEARRDATEAVEMRRGRDEAIAERNKLNERLEQAARELEAERQRVKELAEQQENVTQAGADHATALAAAREEALKLAQERDELCAELERTKSEGTPSAMPDAEREQLNERIKALTAERDELDTLLADGVRRDTELVAQLLAAQESRDEAIASLTAAQKQIEHIVRDRDQVRQQGVDRVLQIEEELQAATTKLIAQEKMIATADQRISEAWRERDQVLEKAHNFDQQRLASIDVAAQLDAAKREIKKLTADLAEAKLEAKAALARPQHRMPPPFPVAKPAATGPVAATIAPVAELDEDALTEKEGRSLLAEMKRCYTTFAKSPNDLSLLNELHCQAQHFAERARVSGFLALHRIGHVFGHLAQDLYKYPEQVNPSTMRTVSQTIDLIGTLLKQKNYAAIKDPAKALVFAVDDDADNCDAIRMAMDCITMRTRCAQEPAVALAEISSDAYDLIFLDVALPHMDGFELCQHIRALPNHAHTPVVFLTGLTTIENRVQSSLSGGNDFIGKPFNLHELGVKAISLVLKASLHME